MPPSHDRLIRLACPPRLAFDLAQEALRACGLRIKKVDAVSGTIEVEKGMSLTSWGHSLQLVIQAGGPLAPNETAIAFRSESKGIQKVDWGANKKIIEQFETRLSSLLEASQKSGDLEKSKWRPSV